MAAAAVASGPWTPSRIARLRRAMRSPRRSRARRPTAATGPVELRETHISWVFLAGERAYKLKKPVVLPFVDYGTAERRREMCEEEVRLNRRLAPDVYLGTRAVIATAEGVALAPAGAPDAIDHVVEMRRFDEARTLAARVLARRRVLPGARRGRPAAGRVPRRRRRARRPRTRRPRCTRRSPRTSTRCSRSRPTASSRARSPRSRASPRPSSRRVAASSRRAPRPAASATATATCAPSTCCSSAASRSSTASSSIPRCGSSTSGCDLAFLLMDLEALGSPAAARAVLDGYRDAGGDPGDDALLAFFSVYRALVRAKVALVRAGQSRRPRAADRLRARAGRARRALRVARAAAGPRHLRGALGDREDAARLRARRRAQACGISTPIRSASASSASPPPRAPARRRTATSFNRRTYAELGRLAREELERARRRARRRDLPAAADRAAFARRARRPAGRLAARRVPRARAACDSSGLGAAPARPAPCPTRTRRSSAYRPRTAGLLDELLPPVSTSSLRTDRPPAEVLDELAALHRRAARPRRLRSSPQRRAGSSGWPLRRPAVASASQLREKGRS